ncbi:hypothetical protein P7K49_025200, partial [Saguinus oedipus]
STSRVCCKFAPSACSSVSRLLPAFSPRSGFLGAVGTAASLAPGPLPRAPAAQCPGLCIWRAPRPAPQRILPVRGAAPHSHLGPAFTRGAGGMQKKLRSGDSGGELLAPEP